MEQKYSVENAGAACLRVINLAPGHAVRQFWDGDIDGKGQGLDVTFLSEAGKDTFEKAFAELPDSDPFKQLPIRRTLYQSRIKPSTATAG